MCGFVGFTNHIDNSNVVLGEMLDKIKHRGPDAEGTYIDENIALGHRRLSIIDVSEAGTQPLYSEDKNLVLVFNGEIYNYQGIRARLIEAGYHFSTQTDSEVLIYGYQEYGAALLQQPVRQGGLAVVNVGDEGKIADIALFRHTDKTSVGRSTRIPHGANFNWIAAYDAAVWN